MNPGPKCIDCNEYLGEGCNKMTHLKIALQYIPHSIKYHTIQTRLIWPPRFSYEQIYYDGHHHVLKLGVLELYWGVG